MASGRVMHQQAEPSLSSDWVSGLKLGHSLRLGTSRQASTQFSLKRGLVQPLIQQGREVFHVDCI